MPRKKPAPIYTKDKGGRPTMPAHLKKRMRGVSLTDDQHARLLARGGSPWLQRLLDGDNPHAELVVDSIMPRTIANSSVVLRDAHSGELVGPLHVGDSARLAVYIPLDLEAP